MPALFTVERIGVGFRWLPMASDGFRVICVGVGCPALLPGIGWAWCVRCCLHCVGAWTGGASVIG